MSMKPWKKNLLQISLPLTAVTFILLIIRTKDLETSLIVSAALFLSSLMWVLIYYRNPDR